jgi:hypothetical protein
LAVDFGLFDEVMVESGAGVEDLDADSAALLAARCGLRWADRASTGRPRTRLITSWLASPISAFTRTRQSECVSCAGMAKSR